MIDNVNKVVIYGQFAKQYDYDRTLDGVDYYIVNFKSDQSARRYIFQVKLLMTLEQVQSITAGTDYRITGELLVSTKFSNFIIRPTAIEKVSDLDEVDRYLSSIEITVKLVKVIDSYKSRNLMICLGRFDSAITQGQHVRLLCYARTGAFVNSVLIPDYEYVTKVSGYLNSYIGEDDQASTSVVVTKFELDPEDPTQTHKNSTIIQAPHEPQIKSGVIAESVEPTAGSTATEELDAHDDAKETPAEENSPTEEAQASADTKEPEKSDE